MKNNFSIEELSLLETTEIKGGSASPSEAPPQNGCINNVAGCNCTIIIGGPPPAAQASCGQEPPPPPGEPSGIKYV
jgi:hypothetical protein